MARQSIAKDQDRQFFVRGQNDPFFCLTRSIQSISAAPGWISDA